MAFLRKFLARATCAVLCWAARGEQVRQVDLIVEAQVPTIRLREADWGKAWRAMIEVGPVRLIAKDPIYEVLPAHLKMLTARGFAYEVVSSDPSPQRLAGLHPGAIQPAPDFDRPLPDDFWAGES